MKRLKDQPPLVLDNGGAEGPISGQDCLNEKTRRSTTPHALCLNANLLKLDKPKQIHVSRDCWMCPRPTQRIRAAFRGGLWPTRNHRKGLELAKRRYLSHVRLLQERVLLRRGFLAGSFRTLGEHNHSIKNNLVVEAVSRPFPLRDHQASQARDVLVIQAAIHPYRPQCTEFVLSTSPPTNLIR